MFGRLLRWHTIYTFSGALAPGRTSRWALAHILVFLFFFCHFVPVLFAFVVLLLDLVSSALSEEIWLRKTSPK